MARTKVVLSPETQIINLFESLDLATAAVMTNVLAARLAQRRDAVPAPAPTPETEPAASAKSAKPIVRRKRRTKAEIEADNKATQDRLARIGSVSAPGSGRRVGLGSTDSKDE